MGLFDSSMIKKLEELGRSSVVSGIGRAISGAISSSERIFFATQKKIAEEEYTKRSAKIRTPSKWKTYDFQEDYTLIDDKDFFDFDKDIEKIFNQRKFNKDLKKYKLLKNLLLNLKKLKQTKEEND
ncbi:hypothetical protein [Campylobacter sp.]|uniref:hypothetical protein n=1 Tax=Campylobacter sp. TaxID=205 RepID=UPI0025BE038A|nr:hypothetical protein [Campylobacter sp.]